MINDLVRNQWFGGQLLAFSAIDGPTDYDNGLTARTSFGLPGIEVKLPGSCTVNFHAPSQVENWVAGDCFGLKSPQGTVTGAFLDAHHLLIEGPCQVTACDRAVAHCSKHGRLLVGATARFDAARIDETLDRAIKQRCAWLTGQQRLRCLSGTARRTLCKVLSVMKTQVCSPQGLMRHCWTTPDRWPHRNMWLWDSAFHSIGWRHLDSELARSMLSAVVDAQRRDGFIAHMMTPHGLSGITQPPILAFSTRLVHDVSPDIEWLASLYPHLCAYIEWDLANRDTDRGGLVEWAINGDPHCRSGESGMDNSPRFDNATHLDAVDFNSFLALECETLASFAAQLGLHEDARKWAALHKRLCGLIARKLWSDEQRFFVDYDMDKGEQSPVLASSGFLPLICQAATKDQALQLAAHLEDPVMFGTPFPVPSVAVRDTAHYAKDMWRGPAWININWLIAYGLERYGLSRSAAKLRQRSMDEIGKFCEQLGVPFEYYDDRCEMAPPALLRKGKCAPEESPYHQVFHDYGWTATLYADMLCAHHSGVQ